MKNIFNLIYIVSSHDDRSKYEIICDDEEYHEIRFIRNDVIP